MLTALRIYEAISSNFQNHYQLIIDNELATLSVKESFLDPINEISSFYYQPKEGVTLAFLIANLGKIQQSRKLIKKFIKQWVKFLSMNHQESQSMKAAKSFIRILQEASSNKDLSKHQKTIEAMIHYAEMDLWPLLFKFSSSHSDKVYHNVTELLWQILCIMSLKLGYFTEL